MDISQLPSGTTVDQQATRHQQTQWPDGIHEEVVSAEDMPTLRAGGMPLDPNDSSPHPAGASFAGAIVSGKRRRMILEKPRTPLSDRTRMTFMKSRWLG